MSLIIFFFADDNRHCCSIYCKADWFGGFSWIFIQYILESKLLIFLHAYTLFMIFSVSLSYIVLLGIENCMYTPLVQIQRDEIYERQVTFSMNKIYLHIFFFFQIWPLPFIFIGNLICGLGGTQRLKQVILHLTNTNACQFNTLHK